MANILQMKLHHVACGILTIANFTLIEYIRVIPKAFTLSMICLIVTDGNILSFEEAKLQYGITGLQFEYDCLVSILPRSWRIVNKKNFLGL